MGKSSINLIALANIPFVQPGDSLAAMIDSSLRAMNQSLQPTDILVIAQKVVSKAENRLVRLDTITPSAEAIELAQVVDKDPRVVQVILNDSNGIIRAKRGLLVMEQQAGWISANAGVDRSNVEPGEDGEDVLALLPVDGDKSAEQIRNDLFTRTGIAPAVLINDSHGRAWRIGTVGVCIGCAGISPVWDQRGLSDLYGYELHSSAECIADELCAAASLLMGQSNEGQPIILIRGYEMPSLDYAPAQSIQRPAEMDAFR